MSYLDNPLDSVDRFIAVAGAIAKIPILESPDFTPAANDLYEIVQKLLTANESMARWLNRFLYFDFRVPNARGLFLELVRDYKTRKSGSEFRDMKFSCGDIWYIYKQNIAQKVDTIFSQDPEAAEETKQAFVELGSADGDMVAFIYDTVLGDIDKFVHNAEPDVDRSDLNGAETLRLQFKVASARLSERLERLAGGLSELVLQYARIARRPVTLI